MNTLCEAVRHALEDEAGVLDPEMAAHLAACGRCAAQAGLLDLLDGLRPGEADDETVRQLLLELPISGWQLRRAAAWLPLAGGGALVAGGLLLVGGVPGGATLATVPGGIYSLAAASALDVAAALRGSADAVRSVLTAAGLSALLWLGASAVAGSFALRALLRRTARGRA